ncbi:MAG: nicotinate (nicotinamide) nucleotide adenylyltransferase [Planctomycetes bacterium]|nr:nicotinate (nicotinamide) nucleotide adenylyltransferase [Planctomycetota bacterium]
MRIGLLGGAFDPPHNGHIAVAKAVLAAKGLDRVDLLVSAQSPHANGKSNAASVQHRLAMARLAVEGHAGLAVEDCETQRHGKSYTVDTLRELKLAHPGNQYFFIIGADMVADLPNWKEPEACMQLAMFVPVLRPGFPMQVFEGLRLSTQAVQSLQLNLVQAPQLDVSSTRIRQAVAAGESISAWVAPAVESYIRAHRLYV